MNLNSEYETMKEIEHMMQAHSLNSKLKKGQMINVNDCFNDSVHDEIDTNDMKSLYLTEPLASNMFNNTRNHILTTDSQDTTFKGSHNLSSFGPNITLDPNASKSGRAKSQYMTGPVHVSIRPRNRVEGSSIDTYEQNISSEYCNSDFIYKAGQSLITRAKQNKLAYKHAIKQAYKKY